MLTSFFLTICHIYPQIHFGQERQNLGRNTGTGRNSPGFGKIRNRGAFCTDLSSGMENCGCSGQNRWNSKPCQTVPISSCSIIILCAHFFPCCMTCITCLLHYVYPCLRSFGCILFPQHIITMVLRTRSDSFLVL